MTGPLFLTQCLETRLEKYLLPHKTKDCTGHLIEIFWKKNQTRSFNRDSTYHRGFSTLKKYQCDSSGLHKFFHHPTIVLRITFHIWKSVDYYFSNKVYRDILRNCYVLTIASKCLCTLFLKNSNLQIFIHEKLRMKLQLNDEKTCVDPWSHIDTFEGWTVVTETIVIRSRSQKTWDCIVRFRKLLWYFIAKKGRKNCD